MAKVYSYLYASRYLQCTGALLDTAHILTAAHCVWNIEATNAADRTYVSTLNFYPGMNGGSLSANSLGTYTWHSVKVLSEFTDQTVRQNKNAATAIILAPNMGLWQD